MDGPLPESRPCIDVRTRSGNYRVVVGRNLLADLGTFVTNAISDQPRQTFAVIDAGVPEEMCEPALDALGRSGLRVGRAELVPSESSKSMATLNRLLVEVAEFGLERREPIVAIGGGIVGDVTGLVAALYRRGVPVIQCPTTLLAMVDASVGGKTGVNLAVGDVLQKNVVGAFHQPALVLADVDALRSLPDRVFRAGLAECIKHALLGSECGDPSLQSFTESTMERVLRRDSGALTELVTRNVRLKASVVTRDEREEAAEGGRALLNLGHTFGHAIETIPGLSSDGDPANAPLNHGEAVALGLVAAHACAHALGRIDPSRLTALESLLARAGLPTRVAGLPATASVLQLMRSDKKSIAGQLRVVLPGADGSVSAVADPPAQALSAGLDRIRA